MNAVMITVDSDERVSERRMQRICLKIPKQELTSLINQSIIFVVCLYGTPLKLPHYGALQMYYYYYNKTNGGNIARRHETRHFIPERAQCTAKSCIVFQSEAGDTGVSCTANC